MCTQPDVKRINSILKKFMDADIDEGEIHWLVRFIDDLRFSKYKNPDKRCTYPFEPMSIGYCWGWASFVDGGNPPKCDKCEMWIANREAEDGN